MNTHNIPARQRRKLLGTPQSPQPIFSGENARRSDQENLGSAHERRSAQRARVRPRQGRKVCHGAFSGPARQTDRAAA